MVQRTRQRTLFKSILRVDVPKFVAPIWMRYTLGDVIGRHPKREITLDWSVDLYWEFAQELLDCYVSTELFFSLRIQRGLYIYMYIYIYYILYIYVYIYKYLCSFFIGWVM